MKSSAWIISFESGSVSLGKDPGALQVIQIIEIHPVAGNILNLGRMALRNQLVEQLGQAHPGKMRVCL
jgi:hypothetical protein